MTSPRFSQQLAERTSVSHSDSEGADFMSDLMRGRGTREDYTALAAQHWFVYEALEHHAGRLREDAVAAPFLRSELTRLPRLEDDLEHLLGAHWKTQISPLPTTARYVERIHAVSDNPTGYVAHHYTRYLGDLSGGQYIARAMTRHFGFADRGIRFYAFPEIDDLSAFKDEYRRALDEAPWDDDARESLIDEVLVAYRLNTELFVDLSRAKSQAAA